VRPIRITLFVIFLIFRSSQSLGQDNEEVSFSEIVESYEKAESSPGTIRYGFNVGANSLRNEALSSSGMIYKLNWKLERPFNYGLYGTFSLLSGTRRGQPVREIGKFRIGGQVFLGRLERFDFWLEGEGKVAFSDSQLSSRYDTYRVGLKNNYRMKRIVGAMAFGHSFRVNEKGTSLQINESGLLINLPRNEKINNLGLDLGGIYDFHFTLGYAIHPKWIISAYLDWYRLQPVKLGHLNLSKDVNWAAVGPELKYSWKSGASLKTRLLLPAMNSRSQREAEMGFWDLDSPIVSSLNWHTELGLTF
jgi:hypothetical protein